MSESSNPPYPPYDPAEFRNQSPPDDKAKLLVRLAVIFNFIMAGIDGVYAIVMAVIAFVMPAIIGANVAAGGGAAPPPPPWVFGLIYGGMALLSLLVGIVKVIGAFKLMRRRPGAWGWGLAAAIVGCPQLWCSFFCFLPLAAAIYTIVILCRQDVRAFLKKSSDENNAMAQA